MSKKFYSGGEEIASKEYVDELNITKQDVIDNENKLSSDLVDDTNNTNKFVSASDITNWNALPGVYCVDVRNNNGVNPFVYNGKKKGLYLINGNYSTSVSKRFYYKVSGQEADAYYISESIEYLYLDVDFNYSEMQTDVNFGYVVYTNSADGNSYKAYIYLANNGKVFFRDTAYIGRYLNDTTQTIAGTKIFSNIPKQNDTTAPTNNQQFTNKKYVDDKVALKQNIIQYSTMPTASSSNLGKIVQFTGTTDSTYTSGYFYKCVSDGATPATYSWEQIDAQPVDIDPFNGGLFNTNNDPFVFEGKDLGVYSFDYANLKSFKFKMLSSDSAKTINNIAPLLLIYYKKVEDIDRTQTNQYFANLFSIQYTGSGVSGKFLNIKLGVSNNTLVESQIGQNDICVLINQNGTGQIIDGRKWFNSPLGLTGTATTIEEQYQVTHKKYVDDKDKALLANIAPEYDNTATYDVGDYATYNGVLYVCNTAITVAENFDSTKWTQTTITGILGNLNSVLATLTTPSNGGGN